MRVALCRKRPAICIGSPQRVIIAFASISPATERHAARPEGASRRELLRRHQDCHIVYFLKSKRRSA